MSMSELESRIRDQAYAIWEREGRPEGCERQHWEQAAREVLASGRNSDAGESAPAKSRRSASKSAVSKPRAKKAA